MPRDGWTQDTVLAQPKGAPSLPRHHRLIGLLHPFSSRWQSRALRKGHLFLFHTKTQNAH